MFNLKIRSGPVAPVAGLALFMSMGGTGYAIGEASHAQPAPAAAVWHVLPLTGGWQAGGFGTQVPGFWLDSNHVVHLRGDIVNGSINLPAFRLPVGARPKSVLYLSVYADNGMSGGLTINPNGKAFLRDNNGGTLVANWTSFDGVSFPIP